MVSRSRWVALLALLGCDQARAPDPVSDRSDVLAACDPEPMIEDAVQCALPDTQEPFAETSIDPQLGLAGNPALRSVDALVRGGPDLLIAAGAYGDTAPDGAWLVAIGPDATRAWSATVAGPSDAVTIRAAGDADGVWIAVARADGDTLARHYDLLGMSLGELIVPDFAVESLQLQPLGAIAMSGTSGGNPSYVGVATDGAELWNGNTNDAEGLYVIAGGDIQYFDGPGASVWDFDPRGTPDAGFPIDVGAERAIITSTGDVLAVGTSLGPLGDNAQIVRLDDGGRLTWSLGLPRVHPETVLEGLMDTTIIAGQSFHCSAGTYIGVFDEVGGLIQDVRVAAPPSPWAVDVDNNLASVGIDADALTLRTFEVES